MRVRAARLPVLVALVVLLPPASLAPAMPASGAAIVGTTSPVRAAPVVRAAPAACPSPPPRSDVITDVPYAQQRYAPDRLAPLADGTGIVVAVIDSGVDGAHPQLRGRVEAGRDLLRGGPDGRQDCNGHGTAVAGIIAARPAAGVAFRGLAPGATILPIRVSEQREIDGRAQGDPGSAAAFAAAIRWAAAEGGADVINLSLTLYRHDPAVAAAIRFARDANVLVVAAVGNRGGPQDGNLKPYPAAYDGVLGVAAIGPDGLRPDFSQHGSFVDVAAPGRGITTTAVGGGHQRPDGTSFAAPFVSATAALIRQRFPRLPATQVADRIIATADPAPGGGRSDGYGHGVLNPYRALTETIGPPVRRSRPLAVAPRPADATPPLQHRRSQVRARARTVAGVGAATILVALLLAMVVPRGVRRRWRPPVGPA